MRGQPRRTTRRSLMYAISIGPGAWAKKKRDYARTVVTELGCLYSFG